MKKLLYTLLLGLPLLTGCSDFLDRYPGDALSPSSFWKTEADAKLALTGCYSQFTSGWDIMYWDCASDNAYNFHIHEGYQVLGNSSMSQSDPGAGMFGFLDIRACNEYLENEGTIAFASETTRARYSAEVRCIRAFLYFQKSFNYGDFPFFTSNFKTPEEAKVARTPQSEIYAFLEKELKESIPSLPETAEAGRFNKGAAQALLMRFYLYTGDHAKALATAKSIEGYSMPALSFEESFLMANQYNSEMILTTESVENNYSFDFTPFLPNSSSGWSSVVPTQSLVDAFETADGLTIQEAQAAGTYDPTNPYVNRDPRLRATIIYPGQNFNGGIFDSVDPKSPDFTASANNASKTGYNFKKFYSNLEQFPQNFWNTAKNFPVFRYAEVLLTIAECKVELNQIDNELYDAVDQVRTRAGMPKVDRVKYATQAKLRELVRRERRVEFAYEGLRRYDVIRWGIGEIAMKGELRTCPRGEVLDEVADPATGDHKVNLNKASDLIEVRKFQNGKSELLPIPQSSLDNNENLTQNPGYDL